MDKNTIKVSIVIPVYNVEKYINICLKSIDLQTYNDIEVVLVDDGSPDNCGHICDEYASMRENVKVIHQKNQGLSIARNNGVLESTGDFITFIDSDDYVSSDYVSYLVYLQRKYDADISVAQDLKVWDDNQITATTEMKANDECLTPSEALREMCYTRKFRGYAVCKLFKRDIVEKYPFPEGMLYEDIATIHKMIGAANKVSCGMKRIYYYRQESNSIMRTHFSEKQWDGLIAVEQQLKYVEENYPEVRDAAVYKCAARINNYMFMLMKPSKENKMVFKKMQYELSKYYDIVNNDPNVRSDFKFRCKSIFAGYIPMIIVYYGVSLSSRIKNRLKQISK